MPVVTLEQMCWADATYDGGVGLCFRMGEEPLGLCSEHHKEITGRDLEVEPKPPIAMPAILNMLGAHV